MYVWKTELDIKLISLLYFLSSIFHSCPFLRRIYMQQYLINALVHSYLSNLNKEGLMIMQAHTKMALYNRNHQTKEYCGINSFMKFLLFCYTDLFRL